MLCDAKMRKSQKCTYLGCKKPYFKEIRVRVFHPESNRKTWQTWYHCKEHFKLFLETKGKGWFTDYKGKQPEAPVIGYEIKNEIM